MDSKTSFQNSQTNQFDLELKILLEKTAFSPEKKQEVLTKMQAFTPQQKIELKFVLLKKLFYDTQLKAQKKLVDEGTKIKSKKQVEEIQVGALNQTLANEDEAKSRAKATLIAQELKSPKTPS